MSSRRAQGKAAAEAAVDWAAERSPVSLVLGRLLDFFFLLGESSLDIFCLP